MKNKIILSICILVIGCFLGGFIFLSLLSCTKSDGSVKKLPDGSLVVNTTTLASDVIGYESTTPMEITVKDGIVVKVVALENQETPRFFERVEKNLVHVWEGLPVEEALLLKVDAVTGCTMSSDAVKKNVQIGLRRIQKEK